jgi:hypothetical protein
VCGDWGWLGAGGQVTSEEDVFLSGDPQVCSEGLDGGMDVLIRGLDLEDGASGANLGLYIKPQMRPRWPPARTVHEATEWHARPLS